MGSPVSPVVANICLEVTEDSAINATPVPLRYWKRYVDDSFCIIEKNAVSSFHDSLNSIDPRISFTIEHEKKLTDIFPRHVSLSGQRKTLYQRISKTQSH